MSVDNPLSLHFSSNSPHSCQIWNSYSHDFLDFLNRLYECGETIYSFDSVLPLITYPLELVEYRAKLNSQMYQVDFHDVQDALNQRITKFFDRVSKYEQFYLFRKDQVDGYAFGNYVPTHTMGIVSPILRKKHLQYLASLIQDYPNLKVACTLEKSEIYFAVNRTGVGIGVGSKESTIWSIILTGDAIVKAFIDKYKQMWDRTVIKMNCSDYFFELAEQIKTRE